MESGNFMRFKFPYEKETGYIVVDLLENDRFWLKKSENIPIKFNWQHSRNEWFINNFILLIIVKLFIFMMFLGGAGKSQYTKRKFITAYNYLKLIRN